MMSFERECDSVGIKVQGYNTDNGVYTAKETTSKLMPNSQTLSLSGVGAHHQNGPAENAIKKHFKKSQNLYVPCCSEMTRQV